MVLELDAMELAYALLFKTSQEFEFRAKEAKDHERTKALVTGLSSEVNKVVKENQRLTKVLEDSEEQRSFSNKSSVRRLT